MRWSGRTALVVAILIVSLLAQPTPLSAAVLANPTTGNLLEYPTQMPAIGVSVVKDGLDSHGHWVQTVRLTINEGGTLADASLIAFGDVDHVNAIFQAAQRANPHLISPAMIPVGQQIDLQIDPASQFVLEAILHGPNTLVQRFTNGVVFTTYPRPNGSVQRLVTFPAGRPTDSFSYPATPTAVKVRPGGRIVDLQFAKGTSFADLVQQTYGTTTYAAAVDLTHQTGWDPTHWPPSSSDVKQVVTDPPAIYQAQPHEVALTPSADPVARARQTTLHQERLKAGIYAVRQESFGTVYHVAVTDPGVTASELSSLVYGSPDHRLEIARAAGYQIPAGAASQQFDPHLLGRAFDLSVNYQDEHFVVSRVVETNGIERIDLVDGAEITTYSSAVHGMVEQVIYPTRYKLIVYRPSKLSLTLAQGLALFHVASNLALPADTANALARQYAAEIIWQWSPGIPRLPGDIPDSIQLVDDPAGPVIRVLVGPPVPRTIVGDVVDALRLENPLIAVLGLVVAGAVVVLFVDLGRRYVSRPPGLRW